jgi:hypothetical protein
MSERVSMKRYSPTRPLEMVKPVGIALPEVEAMTNEPM